MDLGLVLSVQHQFHRSWSGWKEPGPVALVPDQPAAHSAQKAFLVFKVIFTEECCCKFSKMFEGSSSILCFQLSRQLLATPLSDHVVQARICTNQLACSGGE